VCVCVIYNVCVWCVCECNVCVCERVCACVCVPYLCLLVGLLGTLKFFPRLGMRSPDSNFTQCLNKLTIMCIKSGHISRMILKRGRYLNGVVPLTPVFLRGWDFDLNGPQNSSLRSPSAIASSWVRGLGGGRVSCGPCRSLHRTGWSSSNHLHMKMIRS
jgi:hypothetical protein